MELNHGPQVQFVVLAIMDLLNPFECGSNTCWFLEFEFSRSQVAIMDACDLW